MRLTSNALARRTRSRASSLLRTNRATMAGSGAVGGAIVRGARKRRLRGDGSIAVRMNQRPNQPGVIVCTSDGVRPSSARAIARQVDLVGGEQVLQTFTDAPDAGLRLPVQLVACQIAGESTGSPIGLMQFVDRACGPRRQRVSAGHRA